MNDYISRAEAIEYFMINTNWHDEDGYSIDDWDEKRKLLEDYFNGVPPADVQPVVHGEWIKIEYHAYRCSECGKSIITNCDYIKEHKFCFRCGAKMDGKGADNEVN